MLRSISGGRARSSSNGPPRTERMRKNETVTTIQRVTRNQAKRRSRKPLMLLPGRAQSRGRIEALGRPERGDELDPRRVRRALLRQLLVGHPVPELRQVVVLQVLVEAAQARRDDVLGDVVVDGQDRNLVH